MVPFLLRTLPLAALCLVLAACDLPTVDPELEWLLAGNPDTGVASFYGYEFSGRPTANGERFDPEALTAAHPTLPFGSMVEVRRLDTDERIRVRINDRGPYVEGRMIDLALGAARKLDMLEVGLADVEIRVVNG